MSNATELDEGRQRIAVTMTELRHDAGSAAEDHRNLTLTERSTCAQTSTTMGRRFEDGSHDVHARWRAARRNGRILSPGQPEPTRLPGTPVIILPSPDGLSTPDESYLCAHAGDDQRVSDSPTLTLHRRRPSRSRPRSAPAGTIASEVTPHRLPRLRDLAGAAWLVALVVPAVFAAAVAVRAVAAWPGVTAGVPALGADTGMS